MKVIHTLNPIYDSNSKILILGSMPSVKSRQLNFYYANPQNRFWPVLERLFNTSINDKINFLLNNYIALWDVIKSCDIDGSNDASIKNVEVNDVNYILKNSNITKIFVTGKKAYELYNKYLFKETNIEAICLPSPSSANAKYSLDDLVKEYIVIKQFL
ncbi:MAG: DNA-deoxyinosine glycosylase [Bacilli bacterium]|nr:DNA-deoxyinosine glycosylase [Bacilli bacterium]